MFMQMFVSYGKVVQWDKLRLKYMQQGVRNQVKNGWLFQQEGSRLDIVCFLIWDLVLVSSALPYN